MAILAVAIVLRFVPLLLLRDDASLAALEPQAEALVLLSLKLFERAFTVGFVFFGFCSLAIGWLIVRSGFLPPILGAMMLIAGACYLIDTLGVLALPQIATPFDILIPAYAAELGLALWLLVLGINPDKWRALASASAARE